MGARPPLRTCVGCRRKAVQHELVRVIRAEDGTLVAGRTLPGRGAWFCVGSPACIDLATRRGALMRALRGSVTERSVSSLRAEQAGREKMGAHVQDPAGPGPPPSVGTKP